MYTLYMKRENKKPMKNIAEMQPDELSEIKKIVKEFVAKVESVDNEIELLKQDRKELFEDAKATIDTKTLLQVLRVLKIEAGIKYRDTFDTMYAALKKE